MLKNILGAVILTMVMVSGVFADFSINSSKIRVVEAPHYYEFDKQDNPKGYYWCGQTALRIALEANNIYKTTKEIHNDFYSIDHNEQRWRQYYKKNCSGEWCAFPKLLEYSVVKYRNQGNNIYYNRKSFSKKETAFNYIKTQINAGKIVILLSDNFYRYEDKSWVGVGHFFAINGYNIKVNNKWLYVRDPDKKNQTYWFSDTSFSFDTLWKNAKYGSKMVLLTIGHGKFMTRVKL